MIHLEHTNNNFLGKEQLTSTNTGLELVTLVLTLNCFYFLRSLISETKNLTTYKIMYDGLKVFFYKTLLKSQ